LGCRWQAIDRRQAVDPYVSTSSMRVRITFSKIGPLIYIGNLDLLTLWERAARRAGLALAYSQGFHPQAKIQYAAPLPLGFSSRCEMLDMRLDEEIKPAAIGARLQAVLPRGIEILTVESKDDKAPALQTQVRAAEYEITFSEFLDVAEVAPRVETLLAATAILRERRKKRYDLRPLIEALDLVTDPDHGTTRLKMRLKALEGATGRPDEVLDAMGVQRNHATIERTALILGT
jgi:radical SAM-linked protein